MLPPLLYFFFHLHQMRANWVGIDFHWFHRIHFSWITFLFHFLNSFELLRFQNVLTSKKFRLFAFVLYFVGQSKSEFRITTKWRMYGEKKHCVREVINLSGNKETVYFILQSKWRNNNIQKRKKKKKNRLHRRKKNEPTWFQFPLFPRNHEFYTFLFGSKIKEKKKKMKEKNTIGTYYIQFQSIISFFLLFSL